MKDYLTVERVSKHFGGLQALQQSSFAIERHKTTCLVGPNGAGKTTLFNVITGFEQPDEGEIRLDGKRLNGLDPRQVIRAGIARTFQNLRVFEEMTAIDNVMVYLRDDEATGPLDALFRPFHTNAALRRKREAAVGHLAEVNLAHKANELARNLSFGQQKLLCIARALATGAELLLLDEPTSGLSQSALGAMVDTVQKLRAQGRTLLVVEHNTRIVRRIADEIVFLHEGRTVAQGEPEAIMSDPKLAEIYFGGVV
jgi:ABC-type branched-subunit amino acid transport system ATPase component